MNRLVELTMRARGYTPDFLREIDNPSYGQLKDIDKLCARLKEIRDNNIPITVYPDYDTDGISSGTVGFAGLAELGFYVNLYIPDPEGGYGITPAAIDDLMAKHPDTKVIITCDTGINCFDAMDHCNRLGIEMLVTDHHIQEAVGSASIIVNPMRMDETYDHPAICGAFVFYQVLQYFADTYCNFFVQSQIKRLRVFAGIGTISDIMPVLYENRQLVRDAVNICHFIFGSGDTKQVLSIPGCDVYRRAFWGLYHFLKVYESYGVIKDINELNEEFFGFYLAPSFNSVKRMDGDMTRAFGVFFGNDPSGDSDYLYNLNLQRKVVVDREYKNIIAKHQPYAPYVYVSDSAGSGILGLLAAKLMGDSGMPTFVLVKDPDGAYHGSGRAPEWYDFPDESKPFMRMSGHKSAFGASCASDTDLAMFYTILQNDVPRVVQTLGVAEPDYDFTIATDWSADVGIDIALFRDYVFEMDSYRPFGKGFPAPNLRLLFTNDDVVNWKQIGNAKQHLKITLGNGFTVLCWNQGYMISEKDKDEPHVLSGHLDVSEFAGHESVNFIGSF